MWSCRARPAATSVGINIAGWIQRSRPLPRGNIEPGLSPELVPWPRMLRRLSKRGVSVHGEQAGGFKTVLTISAVLGSGLGAINLGLQRYAQRHPHSALAQDVDGDSRRMHNYVVPISSTILGLGLWLAAAFTGPLSGAAAGWAGWWFGAQPQWAVTGLLGLSAGHYAQEILANKWCGPSLLAHHLVAVGAALGMHATSCLRGLLLSWGAIYEAGSLLLCLGYVGVLPRCAGHWAATVSSVAGMGIGLYGLVARQSARRLNGTTWFIVMTLLALGLGRIQEGAANLFRPPKSPQSPAL